MKDGDKQNHDHIQQLQTKISDVEKQSNSRLRKLQGGVDSLKEEMHRPVSIYKDCREDTKSCSIDPKKSRDFWRDCATLDLPLNKEASAQSVVCNSTCELLFPIYCRDGRL